MRSLSRLRLRLAGAFAITFAVALVLVSTALLGWLWLESTGRMENRLESLTRGVEVAVGREGDETPDSSFAYVLEEVRRDWVMGPDGWILLDANGVVLTSHADSSITRAVAEAARAHNQGSIEVPWRGQDLVVRSHIVPAKTPWPAYRVLGVANTEGIERDIENLALTLAVAAPLILLASLAGGYVMARRALQPIESLAASIDALDPHRGLTRVAIEEPVDELGHLATRFNALLDRLDAAFSQNRQFVREAAHQIRTPLTLVRGEAEHALAAPANRDAESLAVLRRIRTASEQMDRRVHDLFLLAEAEAGAVIERDELLELDGLAIEAVDLFRQRASQLGRTLAFGPVEPVAVRGNAGLLREALLELLENGCRYSAEGTAVCVSVVMDSAAGEGVLVVESEIAAPNDLRSPAREQLGQRIVRWIAEGHGGRFTAVSTPLAGRGARYRATIMLPV